MDDNELQAYTPKQERLLEFLAAWLGLDTDELVRRIVISHLNYFDDMFGMYDKPDEDVPPKRGREGGLSRVLDFPPGGGDDRK